MKTSIPSLFGLLTVLLLGAAATAATPSTEANRMAEVSFESAKDYADPFNHVILDAVFTTPNGRQLRVRYASPL